MGRAGDFDYERHGAGYAAQRRTDPLVASHIHAALGSARTVLNVGAGAGSYEPEDRGVVAVEPSATMRAQRPETLLDPVVRGAQSAWGFVDPAVEARSVRRLGEDLASGAWDDRHGRFRTQPQYVGSLRLVVAIP